MKNLILLFSLMMIASVGFSQVKVISNGDVKIGTTNVDPTEKLDVDGIVKSTGNSVIKTGFSGTTLYERTDAAAVLIGAGYRGAGFTFDENFNFEIRSRERLDIQRRLLSAGPILMRGVGSTGYIGLNVNVPAERLHVNGSIQTDQTFIASDKRLKENIKEFNYGLDQVLNINPKKYNYKKNKKQNQKENIGVIAQELSKIAPELVSTFTWVEEDKEGNVVSEEEYLRIDDTSIKWMLVNAIKDQQEIINSQEERIVKLEEMIQSIVDVSGIDQTEVTLSSDVAELKQNKPNPFTGLTIIEYTLPAEANISQIKIFNMNGKLMKSFKLNHIGKGQLKINAPDLPSGTYTYQLVVNGEIINTFKMIHSK